MSQMLEIPSKGSEAMNSALSGRTLLREMVLLDRPQHGLDGAIDRAARACVVSARRAKAIFYGEPKRLWADEQDRIKAAYEARMQDEMRQLDARQALVRAKLDALKGSA
ncbi:hypothetical protein [Roseomonas indoligenes]|uniref:Uncharacterized protein n=1 Tax=Roseomonas indoligenes TaxID=2820811 RepID=A0A940MUG8_9PROT|nr:hypothetical protein [Pararoseomonas indoligenes]MBP0492201.1 hypothetical protein [Pararoseomonas indoligenes]